MPSIPTCSIGGSGTWALDRLAGRGGFPEEIASDAVIETIRDYRTPFGLVPLFKVLDVDGYPVLRVPMHGWRFPVPEAKNTLALFWLLAHFHVKQIVVDASVGGIWATPWDIVVPDDVFVDSTAKVALRELAARISRSPWVRMKEPFCPRIREALMHSARRYSLGDLVVGTYYSTPISVFEAEFEVRMIADTDATVVGQSCGLEAACARLYGMCYGAINPVANYAEGLGDEEWIEGGMEAYYDQIALPVAEIVWQALKEVVKQDRTCDCASYANVGLDKYTQGRGSDAPVQKL